MFLIFFPFAVLKSSMGKGCHFSFSIAETVLTNASSKSGQEVLACNNLGFIIIAVSFSQVTDCGAGSISTAAWTTTLHNQRSK